MTIIRPIILALLPFSQIYLTFTSCRLVIVILITNYTSMIILIFSPSFYPSYFTLLSAFIFCHCLLDKFHLATSIFIIIPFIIVHLTLGQILYLGLNPFNCIATHFFTILYVELFEKDLESYAWVCQGIMMENGV